MSSAYKVGDPHPSARRAIQAGDICIVSAGWGARVAVVDVDSVRGVAEVRSEKGATLTVRVRDLIPIGALPR